MTNVLQVDPIRAAKIDNWIAAVRKSSQNTIDSILEFAKKVFDAETDLKLLDDDALAEFRRKCGLSQSMLSKLKLVGEREALFQSNKDRLPASLSSLYELSKFPDVKLNQVMAEDLRCKTRIELRELSGEKKKPLSTQNLLSLRVKAGIESDRLSDATNNIKVAVSDISKKCGFEIMVAGAAFDAEEKQKEQNRLAEIREKLKVKKIKSAVRTQYNQFLQQLRSSGKKRMEMTAAFKGRFGMTYAELVKESDPLTTFEKWQTADWITQDEREIYARRILARVPVPASGGTKNSDETRSFPVESIKQEPSSEIKESEEIERLLAEAFS